MAEMDQPKKALPQPENHIVAKIAIARAQMAPEIGRQRFARSVQIGHRGRNETAQGNTLVTKE